jgi:hypothetical protein
MRNHAIGGVRKVADIAILNVDVLCSANVGDTDGNVCVSGLGPDYAGRRESECEKQASENEQCARGAAKQQDGLHRYLPILRRARCSADLR